MILSESTAQLCERCGAPLSISVGMPGCLNCLLNVGLEETSARRYQHYEVELSADGKMRRELGRGAMGVTYRAIDLNLGAPVALKVISARFSKQAEARRRLHEEARVAASLRHPNVASVFHFGETPTGDCFYAMELVEGETLEAWVRRAGPLGAAIVLEIAAQVARALRAAEKHGLVHRDLKPSNLMVLPNDQGRPQDLVVKVIDFGLAKIVSPGDAPERAAQSGFSGTPGFASPEQWQAGGRALDLRSDIYSLGATLSFALCGQAPEDPSRTMALLRKAKVPPRVIALLQRMLAPSPDDRPQLAHELLRAIEKCQRQLAFARQRPRWVAAAFVLLLVCLGTGFGLTKYVAHALAPATSPEKSIAVLPFRSLSTDKENAFFAVGVQDEVLSDLSQIADLKVTSRTSVMQYAGEQPRNMRAIGRSLGVRNVVEGSVQRIGQHVRVVTQLIDARTDNHLWSQTYDRDLSDTFAVEDEIAEQIAQQLAAKISPHERSLIQEKPTSDLTAYGFYSRALSLDFTQEHTDEKIAFLRQAIERDPDFVLAYCFLARLYDRKALEEFYNFHRDRENYSKLAQKTIERALHLRPDRGEPHLALAQHAFVNMRYPEARAELKIARPLLPNDSAAIFLEARVDRRENRWADALVKARRAVDLDPHHEFTIGWIAQCYAMMRRYDEGEKFVREAEVRNPELGPRLNGYLADFALRKGDLAGARALSSAEATHNDFSTHFRAAYFARDYTGALQIIAAAKPEFVQSEMGLRSPRSEGEGQVFLHGGMKDKVLPIFRALRAADDLGTNPETRNEWYYTWIAYHDAILGEKEKAIAEARKAVDLHPPALDPVNGCTMIERLALVYTVVGEADLAIEQLQMLARMPSNISYGELRYNPDWDALRGDPRFQQLIASLEPR
jgi:TolB-like protein/predicted Ser/Thr protein kinase